MELILDYYLIFLLWFFCLLLIAFAFYLYNKTKNVNETKRDKKDIVFFKIALISILFIASFDSSFFMKEHIDNKLLNDAINSYLDEGFMVINDDNESVCNIPNSIIYLNYKGQETTKKDHIFKLCI